MARSLRASGGGGGGELEGAFVVAVEVLVAVWLDEAGFVVFMEDEFCLRDLARCFLEGMVML